MKRFMLFAGKHYYPKGGLNDYIASFDTFEDAKEYVIMRNNLVEEDEPRFYDWANVLDREVVSDDGERIDIRLTE